MQYTIDLPENVTTAIKHRVEELKKSYGEKLPPEVLPTEERLLTVAVNQLLTDQQIALAVKEFEQSLDILVGLAKKGILGGQSPKRKYQKQTRPTPVGGKTPPR